MPCNNHECAEVCLATHKLDRPKVLNDLVSKQHHSQENRASKTTVAEETSVEVPSVETDDDDDTALCDDNEID